MGPNRIHKFIRSISMRLSGAELSKVLIVGIMCITIIALVEMIFGIGEQRKEIKSLKNELRMQREMDILMKELED